MFNSATISDLSHLSSSSSIVVPQFNWNYIARNFFNFLMITYVILILSPNIFTARSENWISLQNYHSKLLAEQNCDASALFEDEYLLDMQILTIWSLRIIFFWADPENVDPAVGSPHVQPILNYLMLYIEQFFMLSIGYCYMVHLKLP